MHIMTLLIIIAISFLLYICLPLRILVFHFLGSIKYFFIDIYNFFIHRSFKYAPVGFLDAYCGLFGQGKTLSAVSYAVRYYNRYNNKKVYDPIRKVYCTQIVNVLSNVNINSIPYTPFISLRQIVDIAEQAKDFNETNNMRLVTLVLGDEFSVQLNSRNFKSNLDPLTLNSILTCRHHGIGMIYTAQRFNHVDALLRQVTQNVIQCRKIWRFQCLNFYDGQEVENSNNDSKLRPRRRKGFLTTQKIYDQYDSLAVVDNLIKDYRAGAIIPETRILELTGGSSPDPAHGSSRKKKKRRQK